MFPWQVIDTRFIWILWAARQYNVSCSVFLFLVGWMVEHTIVPCNKSEYCGRECQRCAENLGKNFHIRTLARF